MTWRATLGTCSLDDDALEARRAEWTALDVHRSSADVRPDGFRITYAPAPGVADELRRLAAAEGGCCGFATWRVETEGEVLVLAVTGPQPGIAELQRTFLPAR